MYGNMVNERDTVLYREYEWARRRFHRLSCTPIIYRDVHISNMIDIKP
jgi:hypothetical protein